MFGPDLGKLSELMERLTKAVERIADSLERMEQRATLDAKGAETARGKSVESSSHG